MDVYNHDQVVNISQLLRDTIALFLPYAEKKQIKLSTEITENLYTKADPDALLRVFNNLIENALKYTASGGSVFISLQAENSVLKFCVEDNGMGIPTALQSSIFEPYVQINSEKKNNQGMGLGLSIVKKITEQLQAEINIHSNPEEKPGTRISIHFLVSDSSAAINHVIGEKLYLDLDVLEIKEQAFDPEKTTLLVVEDNVSLLNLLVNDLQKKYNVFYAQSGNQAIEKLKSIPTLDLIISDVMMDDGDGFAFLEFVSKQKRLSLVPFIFLTAKTDVTNKISGLSMGAMDYMNKPFAISELEYKIESIISKIKQNAEALIQQAYTNLRSNALYEKGETEKSTKSLDEKLKSFQLTSREMEIAHLIVKGESTKSIAEQLFISENTVNKHIQNIFEKTSVTSRLELANKLTQ
jgi:DNA-binding NarL/FixJ family response regulator/two-component sensor histidine kinase